MNKQNVILVDGGINFCNQIGKHFEEHDSLNYLNSDFAKEPKELERELVTKEINGLRQMIEQGKFLDRNYLITTDNSAESTLILKTLAQNSELASKLRKVILLCYNYDLNELEQMKRTKEGQEKLGLIKDKLEVIPYDEEGIREFDRDEDIEHVKNSIDSVIGKDNFLNFIKDKLKNLRNQISLIFRVSFDYNK